MDKAKKWLLISLNYGFVQKFIPIAGVLGFFGNLVFFAFEKYGLGYWDSFAIRLAVSTMWGLLVFFPKKGDLTWKHKVYFETVIVICLPMMFTYIAMMNRLNPFWYASLVFAGLIYGICTKPLLFLLLYPLLAGFAMLLYHWQFPLEKEILSICFQAHSIAFFGGIISNSLKTIMEYNHEALLLEKEKTYQAAFNLELLKKETEQAKQTAEENQRHITEMQSAYNEIKKREEFLARYVRPSIVKEIRSGKNPLEHKHEVRQMAILFCDIRGFTKLTETLTLADTPKYLNAYFSQMTPALVDNNGEVDKYIGDAIMGNFENGADAVRAAVAMRRALHDYNRVMMKAGKFLLRNGISISKGEIMWGNFGSIEKLDRTAMGEDVNIASRLESKTKTYNVEILATEEVILDLNKSGNFRWIDTVQVVGSSRILKLYEIYDHQPDEVIEYKNKTKDIMEKALTIYFQKGIRDALRLFLSIKEHAPAHLYMEGEIMDSLMDYYIQKCKDWISNPDAWELMQKWEGYHAFTEK